MQQLAARNPYFNILAPKVAGNLSTETYEQPLPDLQSDLSGLRSQPFCFGLENRGDRYNSTKMVDTPSGH